MDELVLASDERERLSRRRMAQLAVGGVLTAVAGAVTLRGAAAREAEPGDDRGGAGGGADDPPGDDRGGNGGHDDPAADDRGGHRRRRGRR